MLQNAYFLAKIGADTAENEQHFAEILPTEILPTACCISTPRRDWPLPIVHLSGAGAALRIEGKLRSHGSAPAPETRGMRQTLAGSFSAVSKRNFASKYALDSSHRDLHNALLCTVLESIIEKWGKKDRSLISKISSKIAEFFSDLNLTKFSQFLPEFISEFLLNSDQ